MAPATKEEELREMHDCLLAKATSVYKLLSGSSYLTPPFGLVGSLSTTAARR